MKSEAKCPFNHAVIGDATTNRDWWPNQLRVDLLNQHSARSNPLDAGFDYRDGRVPGLRTHGGMVLRTDQIEIGGQRKADQPGDDQRENQDIAPGPVEF